MFNLATHFVLGYHGCDAKTAKDVLSGKPLNYSTNDYDWLGSGIYFWEANPKRAYEFARQMAAKPRGASRVARPAVIGAVIDLRNCLDMMSSHSIDLVEKTYKSLADIFDIVGFDLPKNSDDPDKLRRNLDCLVINKLHQFRENLNEVPFDTVRALFPEGDPLYDGAGFRTQTHVQICVRNPDCIKGVFRVSDSYLENC